MVSKRSRATLTDFQMVDTSCWFVKDLVTSLAQPIGKFSLEVVRYAHKLLIKSPQFKGDLAAHRKITAHKLADPSCPHRGEMEAIVLRKVLSFVPRLDYPPGDQGCSCPFQR